ncbi:MAG: hypothetical protein KKD17_06280 [Nanoarchaeota archaeon]|nr:hypothetical protein [Nanoarchaeota archaeon]
MQKKRQPHRTTAESRELLKSIIRFMKLNQQLSIQELVGLYTEVSPEEAVPVSIFSTSLSPSESLCKYLKENRSLSFHEIAVILNRDDRSVWTSYARALRKSSNAIVPKEEDILVPLPVFQDRSMSILEHVVNYLKTNYNLSNSKIARAINKNPSSIATVANRASAKGFGQGGKAR